MSPPLPPQDYDITLVTAVPRTKLSKVKLPTNVDVGEKFAGFIIRISVRDESQTKAITGNESLTINGLKLKVFDKCGTLEGYGKRNAEGYREVHKLALSFHAGWKRDYKLERHGRRKGFIAVDEFRFLQPGIFKIAFDVWLNGYGNLGLTPEEQVVKVRPGKGWGREVDVGGSI
jgi:hypothetical protein